MQPTRRAGTGRKTWSPGGVLYFVRDPVLVRSQAISRRSGRRAVRGARLYRPRRPRLDLPGDRPQRPQPLGRAQGSGPLGRRRRHGHRCSRSTRPRRGGTPEHRPDPQLRRAQGFGGHEGRLHRHGVRRRNVAQADSYRRTTGPCRPTKLSPTSSRSRRLSAICTRRDWPTATSSPTT